MRVRLILIISLLLTGNALLHAQESLDSIGQLPAKYLDDVSAKTGRLEQKLEDKTDKALEQMMKLEGRVRRKLQGIDSVKAKQLLENAQQEYKFLQYRLQHATALNQYVPSLDTLLTSVKFIQQNQELISRLKGGEKKLEDALDKVNGLQDQFQRAEEIKKFLKERREFLREQLANLGFAKELKKLNKQAYYYSQQVNEYVAALKDSKKAEQKAIELLSQTKLFRDFMRRNSLFASLFPVPGNPSISGNQATQAGFASLQTRAQVNNFMAQNGMTSSVNSSPLQRNIQDAQGQVNQLRNMLGKIKGTNGSDLDMPDFKPNSQKTKSFLKRLEFGTDLQSQRANGFFPVTSDLGFSIGYKLNDKSIIGIGASYKIGWGKNWSNIKVTSQGMGLRSFIDWNMKGNFWISGGYEQNYRTAFNTIGQLKDLSAWQQSGLLGMTKTFSLKSNFFKKAKLQLLWDFLSYQQVPRTSPLLFRVGYNF